MIKMEETKSIVRGIQNVGIGDVVLFSHQGYNKEIAGFVKAIDSKYVTISHENPVKDDAIIYRRGRSGFFLGILTKGDKKYEIAGFNHCENLTDKNDDSEEFKPINSGKLSDVDISDIIMLSSQSEKLQVSGFVIGKKANGIALSHESPDSYFSSSDRMGPRSGEFGSDCKGDKFYLYEGFKNYKVLKDSQGSKTKHLKLNPVDDEEL